MSVLTLAGKAINWSKPPKATTRVMWSRRDMYGRKVTGSLRTIALLDHTDDLCVKKYGTHLVVIQPSYNTGVAASAGTHDYDACLDVYIPGVSWSNQEKFFRANGWGAYHRKPPKFGHHIHMFALPPQEGKDRADDYHVAGFKVGRFVDGGWSLFKRKTTSAQIEAYYWGRDALASNARDTGWRPPNIKATIFDLKAWIAKKAPKPSPVETTDEWFTHVHLNTWGDDGGEGERTIAKRIPEMVKGLIRTVHTKAKPEVITLNEVKASQRPLWEKAMKAAGYRPALMEAGNAIFVRMDVPYRRAISRFLSPQGEGRKEAVGLCQIYPNGMWANILVSHLDYRTGPRFDILRVDQGKNVIRWAKTFSVTTMIPRIDRQSIALDENSEAWVRDKAFLPAGYKVARKIGIDAIYTGAKRPVRSGTSSKTASDHPILRAIYGKAKAKS